MPSFAQSTWIWKKKSQRRTCGLWLLCQHLEMDSERLPSFEMICSTQKFRILVDIEGSCCCFCLGNAYNLSSQEKCWVEASLWLLFVLSDVSWRLHAGTMWCPLKPKSAGCE